MKTCVLVLFLFIRFSCFAQSDSLLLNVQSLKSSLRQYYIKKTEAEQEEYMYNLKFKWLMFLPSFGWNFIANTPSLSYNTNELSNAINYKRRKTSKLESIRKQNEVQFNRDLNDVVVMCENLKLQISTYNLLELNFTIINESFELIELSYKNAELKPSEYLQKKISYQSALLNKQKTLNDLILYRNEILIKAKKQKWEELFK